MMGKITNYYNDNVTRFPLPYKAELLQDASLQLLQDFANKLAYGVILIDFDGNIQFRNQASYESLPSGPQLQSAAQTNSIFHFFSEQQLTDFIALFSQAIRRHEHLVCEKAIGGQQFKIERICNDYVELLLVSIQEIEKQIDPVQQDSNSIFNLADYDKITGLPCRDLFIRKLTQFIDNNAPLLILFIDLDNFKRLNNIYSHDVGDQMLQQTAGRLTHCCRGKDMVARLGDDEFSIILELNDDTGMSQEDFTNRVMQSIQECFYINGNDYYISASIGRVMFPDDGKNADELIKFADLAVAEAKRTGKNNIKSFYPAMHENILRRNDIEERLHHAIEDNDLTLYFQPISSVAKSQVVGVEALLRWFPEDGNAISPGEFVPIAEESNLILKLDEWVLTHAIKTLSQLNKGDYPDLYMSVNLSCKQFVNTGLASKIESLLQTYQAEASHLIIEITEHRLMENVQLATEIMRRLVKLGVKISIDDFGTGHSSLSYLRNFPVSSLKIDKSFVDAIWYGEGDLTILNSIIGLGKNLGLKIVAEGVETESQLMFLKSRQCDFIQGYYYSPPLAIDKLDKLLKTHRPL